MTVGWFLAAGVVWGTCAGDSDVAGEWIFEPLDDEPEWALNSGVDEDWGNLGLTGGAFFSTNVPPGHCGCGHSLLLPGTNGVAGAVSINEYDPLAGADKFSILAWVRRDSGAGSNLSARIFSDADSTAPTNTTSGVEFRFSGNAGNLALRINGTEVASTVGGVSPTNGEWHHVAVVYDGTREATNPATRNVHFYVDGIQRGTGSVLQDAVAAANGAPVVLGNASPSRTASNLLAGNVDDVMVLPGWAPEAVGNGQTNEAVMCFMETDDDIFPPFLAVPADVEAEADECMEAAKVQLGAATAWDSCGTVFVTNDAPATFEVGLTEVTWSATDAAGNESTATQTVTVVPSRTGDCDNDGLTDYEEEMVLGTNATVWDTDGDGIGDGDEVALGFDPANAEDCLKVTIHATLYNPEGTDAGKEWVELHSASSQTVDLGGMCLQVGRTTGWTTAVVFSAGTLLAPGGWLLVGESMVGNADVTAVLDIPNPWGTDSDTGLRLIRNGLVMDALFIDGGEDFNNLELDETGWLSTHGAWAHAGTILERQLPGLDTNRREDWHEMPGRAPRTSSFTADSDGDGLSDGEEWSGSANPWGEPTNPWNADSDGDSLDDYAECVTYGTNPNTWATDGDIYPRMPAGTTVANWPGSDPFELREGWNPLVADQNANGTPDSWEMAFALWNLDLEGDADGDGVDNLTELRQNSNPLDGGNSEPQPFVARFESSLPGWENTGMCDVGLNGWVRLYFEGVREKLPTAVWVFEGRQPEPFSITRSALCDWHLAFTDTQHALATLQLEPGIRGYVQTTDLGWRREYYNTPGGEYQIGCITLKSVEIVGAPTNGLVVCKGTPVTMVAHLYPETFVPPDGEPKWMYQRRKLGSSWDEWTPFSENAQGLVYTHTTDLSGIFRVKAVLHLADSLAIEQLFTRRVDENPNGYGEIGKPDTIGVADTPFQVDFSALARSWMGNTNYARDGTVPALHGFPEIPAGKYKCNIFVAHRAVQAGATVPAINGWPRKYPPLANQWAGETDTHPFRPGKQTDIEGWALEDSQYPQPGFIVAHPNSDGHGHVGIVDYDGEGIGAGERGTVHKQNKLFWEDTSKFRKYSE